MDRNLLIISERFQGDGSKRERCELGHTLHSSGIHCIDRYHAFPFAVRRFCVGASDANFTRLQLTCTIMSIADSLTQLICAPESTSIDSGIMSMVTAPGNMSFSFDPPGL